jgi:hypothetical protein
MHSKYFNVIGSNFLHQRLHLTCLQVVCVENFWVAFFDPTVGKS